MSEEKVLEQMEKTSASPEAPGKYGVEQLGKLEGLDAVRKKPGMYIGGTDERALHHCAPIGSADVHPRFLPHGVQSFKFAQLLDTIFSRSLGRSTRIFSLFQHFFFRHKGRSDRAKQPPVSGAKS